MMPSSSYSLQSLRRMMSQCVGKAGSVLSWRHSSFVETSIQMEASEARVCCPMVLAVSNIQVCIHSCSEYLILSCRLCGEFNTLFHTRHNNSFCLQSMGIAEAMVRHVPARTDRDYPPISETGMARGQRVHCTTYPPVRNTPRAEFCLRWEVPSFCGFHKRHVPLGISRDEKSPDERPATGFLRGEAYYSLSDVIYRRRYRRLHTWHRFLGPGRREEPLGFDDSSHEQC